MVWNPRIEIVTGEIERICLRKAYSFASIFSDDPVTNSGAIIVSDGAIVSEGANRISKGIEATADKLVDREWKYEFIVHAEQEAIFRAARNGKATAGAIMYAPWMACTPCAKAIIASGITTLI
ncbi:MAG TPA: deaminase [Candidatus Nanoarchaeia archaeon]|nr:deaminase [Candidatus Nanoarchaeia archaeon]